MPKVKSISTKSGHLTVTEKKHIKILFSKELFHNKVNTKTYKIEATDSGYKVLILENAYSESAGKVVVGHNKHVATFTVKLVEPPVDAAEEDSETENNYGINAESDLKNLGSLMNKIVNTSDKEKCQQITQEIKKISKAWDYNFGCSMLYIYLQNKAETEMKNFTKTEIINRDLKRLTLKHGKKWCTKYYEQINRLFNPNKHTIIEYRSAGVVILEDKKYIFHAICDMNLKKWSKSFVLNITEEYDNDYQAYSIKDIPNTKKFENLTIQTREIGKDCEVSLIEQCLKEFEGDKHLEKVFLYKIKQGCSIDDARMTALRTSLIDDSDINVCGHEIFDIDGFKKLANQLK